MATWEFQHLQSIAKQNGWHQFISMQDYHSLLYRESEREMIPYCRYSGVGYIFYSRLARGLIARPYNAGDALVSNRQEHDTYSDVLLGEVSKSDITVIERMEELARKKGASMATAALAWHLMNGSVPIVGLGSIDRVTQAVEAVAMVKAGRLTKEDIQFLEEAYVAKP